MLHSFGVDGCILCMADMAEIRTHDLSAPCGLRGCKNRPAPFPGRMSYKALNQVWFLFYILACVIRSRCLLGPFLCIVSFR